MKEALDLRACLQLFELDQGVESAGPLFEEPKRRLADDAAFKAQWMRYQALQALALEAAPELPSKLLRQAQRACERAGLTRRLADSTGDETARALLLAQGTRGEASFPWKPLFFLSVAAALAWYSLVPGPSLFKPAEPPRPEATEEPFAFEFQPLTVTAEAGPSPVPVSAPEEDPEAPEAPPARAAKRLLIAHLKSANKPAGAAQAPRIEATTAVPSSTATPRPAELPTSSATRTPLPEHTRSATPSATIAEAVLAIPAWVAEPETVATMVPTLTETPAARPTVAVQSSPVDGVNKPNDIQLEFASELAEPSQKIKVDLTLSLPGAGPVDLRIFNSRGTRVQTLADKILSAGRHRFVWSGLGSDGKALPPGTYYLRVMTRWSSRVETLEVR